MRRRFVGMATALSLAACSLQPHYVRPEAPIPPSWPVGDAYLRQSEAALPSVSYPDIFRDPRLRSLIEQALANNRDLRVAAANIAAARARYRIQRSELLPTVSADAGARFGDSGSAGSVTGGTGAGSNSSYSVDLGITAFEIDLFGRVRSLSDAALAQYFATEAAARATRLTLVGDVATIWLTVAADRSLLRIAEQTVASAQNSVRLTQARLQGGIAPRTDLRQAQTILDQARADAASSRTAVAQDMNALRLLVGADVDPTLLPESIESVEGTLAELRPGLDSTILLRRPDVVQAEYLLRAANAQIGAARAALFPRISLTGIAGLASSALGSLFSGDAFNWSVSPTVSYSIFDFGAARAGVAESRAQREAALATWESTVQTAFREVADALARRGTIDDQEQANRDLVAAASDNYTLSQARYRGGIDSFLQALDAQRSLYNAQRSLVGTQLERAANLVTLYRVLGGDSLIEAAPQGPQPLSAP